MSLSEAFKKLIREAESGRELTRDELVQLLEAPEELDRELFSAADRIRKQMVGEEIYLRGIVEFSNFCERNCLYCGLRNRADTISRYRMTVDEIVDAVRHVRSFGVPTVVFQSGEDSFYETPVLCDLATSIKKETGRVVTLSVGERNEDDYRAFREAGVDRYLLKHETASPDLYRHFRPGCECDDRIRSLRTLKKLGFETGTGNMVGLPGQTAEILAADLLLMKDLDADMLGIGPFIAHPETPLAQHESGSLRMTLRVVALARLVTGNTNIPATTALATLHPRGRIMALQAGANVIMPDFTPEQYKTRYHIYPGRADVGSVSEVMRKIKTDCASIGRSISLDVGNRSTMKRT